MFGKSVYTGFFCVIMLIGGHGMGKIKTNVIELEKVKKERVNYSEEYKQIQKEADEAIESNKRREIEVYKKAKDFIANNYVIVDGGAGDDVMFALCSGQMDVRPLTRAFCQAFSGKGGGKPDMTQGKIRRMETETLRKWLQENR